VKPAATPTVSRRQRLATTVLSSPNMGKLLASYGSDAFVIQPCPGLASGREGRAASDQTRALVKRTSSRSSTGVQISSSRRTIRSCGRSFRRWRDLVSIIDPATPIARSFAAPPQSTGLIGAAGGTERFWTTGTLEIVGPIMRQLWGKTAEVMPL
jgi:hypothetical protein